MRQEFTKKTKALAFQRANGKCENCTVSLSVGKIEYDHRIACALAGGNELDNCVVLCKACHSIKTNTSDKKIIAKVRRIKEKHFSIKTTKTSLPFGKNSKFKKKLNGEIVPR